MKIDTLYFPVPFRFHFKRNVVLAARFGLTVLLATGAATLRVSRQTSMAPPPTVRAQMPQMRTALAYAPQPSAYSPAPGSTSALFSFHREDAGSDGMTRIQIDARQTAAAPVSPFLFGNFIEHLGGVVYPGLWAQALINPNLETVEPLRLNERDSAPPGWDLDERALFRQNRKEQLGFHSFSYVSLLPGPAGQSGGMLSQTVYLPVHRTRVYVGSLYARLLLDRDTDGAKGPAQGTLQVMLRQGESTGRTVAQTNIVVTKDDWNKHEFRLTIPPNAVQKGERLTFALRQADGGPIEIDQIELFPDDSVSGVDRDVLKRAQDWKIPLMRWPGGNFASGYHWQDGIGKREERPTRKNEAWGGIEPNHFGTDEFLAFCRKLNAVPQLTVNAGNGTPEEAASWVQYCNAPADTPYGKLRARNGHPAPYNVRLWEVGNELYGDWQIGHTVAKDNADRFVAFRNVLLKTDPNLRLIATGKGDEFTPAGMQRDTVWNEALLRAAVAGGGKAPDYVSLHPLVPLPGALRTFTYDEQYESAMAHPTFLDRVLFPKLVNQIQQIAGPDAKTRIAVTEWGIIVGGNRWRESPNHDTVAGATYNALCLNAMLRNSDWIGLANMTAFMHGGGIKKPGGVVIVDPQYYTQQLYAKANLVVPVKTSASGPGSDVPARGDLPAISNVPDVDVFAALDRSGKQLTVCAVNRHRSAGRKIQIDLAGFAAATVTGELLTSANPDDRNTMEIPDKVAPRPLTITGNEKKHDAELPPHSFALITFRRR